MAYSERFFEHTHESELYKIKHLAQEFQTACVPKQLDWPQRRPFNKVQTISRINKKKEKKKEKLKVSNHFASS
jgi:hypothetical protein